MHTTTGGQMTQEALKQARRMGKQGLTEASREAFAQPAQEINQPEIFCGVDYAGGVLAVSVMRRRPDDVAELLHSERIELAAPVDYIASIIACRDALDAQPVPRRWVGLTNNELQPIADEYRILFGSWVEDFARAIEAKLKEKNI
jgi:hypothetical protein